jgi:hypothetical protein
MNSNIYDIQTTAMVMTKKIHYDNEDATMTIYHHIVWPRYTMTKKKLIWQHMTITTAKLFMITMKLIWQNMITTACPHQKMLYLRSGTRWRRADAIPSARNYSPYGTGTSGILANATNTSGIQYTSGTVFWRILPVRSTRYYTVVGTSTVQNK